jgi:alanine-glyoxylate transaminase/(R)-3-amino-2-methylpropionate-pyruvate transaminase
MCCQTQRPCDCPEGVCQATDLYIDQLDDVLKHSMPKDKCGAFIAESIQVRGFLIAHFVSFFLRGKLL